jgi:membrane-associated phospholipid phosphatase
VLILLVGFSAVWTRLHTLSQVLLEYAAGGLILFGGLWWLEGHGRLVPIPRTTPDGDCEVTRIPSGQERV